MKTSEQLILNMYRTAHMSPSIEDMNAMVTEAQIDAVREGFLRTIADVRHMLVTHAKDRSTAEIKTLAEFHELLIIFQRDIENAKSA